MILESDSVEAVGPILEWGGCSIEHRAILHACKELLARDWSVEIRNIFRQANMTANWSAKWAAKQETGVFEWLEPPPQLGLIIVEDEQEMEFLHIGDVLN